MVRKETYNYDTLQFEECIRYSYMDAMFILNVNLEELEKLIDNDVLETDEDEYVIGNSVERAWFKTGRV